MLDVRKKLNRLLALEQENFEDNLASRIQVCSMSNSQKQIRILSDEIFCCFQIESKSQISVGFCVRVENYPVQNLEKNI